MKMGRLVVVLPVLYCIAFAHLIDADQLKEQLQRAGRSLMGGTIPDVCIDYKSSKAGPNLFPCVKTGIV